MTEKITKTTSAAKKADILLPANAEKEQIQQNQPKRDQKRESVRKQAKVYISAIDGIDAAKRSVKGLESAQGYIRKQLGSRLHLRKSPELRFIADDSIEKGMDLFEKIKEITHED